MRSGYWAENQYPAMLTEIKEELTLQEIDASLAFIHGVTSPLWKRAELSCRALFLLLPSSPQGKAMSESPSPEVSLELTWTPGQNWATQLHHSWQPWVCCSSTAYPLGKELQIFPLLIWLLGLIANAGLELHIQSFMRLNVTASSELTGGWVSLRRTEEKLHFYKLNFFKAKRSQKVCEDDKSVFELSSWQHKRLEQISPQKAQRNFSSNLTQVKSSTYSTMQISFPPNRKSQKPSPVSSCFISHTPVLQANGGLYLLPQLCAEFYWAMFLKVPARGLMFIQTV